MEFPNTVIHIVGNFFILKYLIHSTRNCTVFGMLICLHEIRVLLRSFSTKTQYEKNRIFIVIEHSLFIFFMAVYV